MYLLQLVQALKYENFDSMQELEMPDRQMITTLDEKPTSHSIAAKEKDFSDNSTSSIPGRSSPTGNLSDVASKGHSSSDASLSSNLSAIVGAMSSDLTSISINKKGDTDFNVEQPDLAAFLIHRACENTTLANFFFW
jgi:hypothetical protein